MKLWLFVLLLVLIAIPTFLQVMLSGDERQRQDAFVFDQMMNRIMSKEHISEFTAAPGVLTECVFPENQTTFTTGNSSVLLVGMKNKGELPLSTYGLRAYIYRPNDYQDVVQDLKFRVAPGLVPPSFTTTYAYMFAVRQYVKGGTYNLVGSISYVMAGHIFLNTFYNGTIEIAEAHDPVIYEHAIVTVALVVFSIVVAVYAYIGIKKDITKEVEKLQEIADRLQAN